MNTLDARLLAALRSAAVHFPASDLAAQLGASADEIFARIGELRSAGFEIEEVPALGFRLAAAPDRLIADDLASRLGPCAVAREIVVFEQTDSTNDLALKRGREGAAGGLAIFAERQNAGRGRFGRRWESAAHRGLWFSLLLRPALPIAQWTRLTTWAAVSVAAAVERASGVRTVIKWPNDVYVDGRKVAGILIESGAGGDAPPFVVVGIGVNVNHEAGDFPAELSEKTTSLRIAAGRVFDRTAIAAAILRELEARLDALPGRFSEVISEARARSSLLGNWVRFLGCDGPIEGLAEELDADGRLLIRTAGGSLDRLSAGEVTMVASSLPGAASARAEGSLGAHD